MAANAFGERRPRRLGSSTHRASVGAYRRSFPSYDVEVTATRESLPPGTSWAVHALNPHADEVGVWSAADAGQV